MDKDSVDQTVGIIDFTKRNVRNLYGGSPFIRNPS